MFKRQFEKSLIKRTNKTEKIVLYLGTKGVIYILMLKLSFMQYFFLKYAININGSLTIFSNIHRIEKMTIQSSI